MRSRSSSAGAVAWFKYKTRPEVVQICDLQMEDRSSLRSHQSHANSRMETLGISVRSTTLLFPPTFAYMAPHSYTTSVSQTYHWTKRPRPLAGHHLKAEGSRRQPQVPVSSYMHENTYNPSCTTQRHRSYVLMRGKGSGVTLCRSSAAVLDVMR